jgi:hypothetical protein
MRHFSIILFIFFGLLVKGQNNYKPSVIVLDPYQVVNDTTLHAEIEKFSYLLDYTQQDEKQILDSLGKKKNNIQIMDIAEFHYRKQMNFASSFTLFLYGIISYKIFGERENCIVIPSHDKTDGTIEKLKIIAKKNNVRWIVNPLLLQTFKKEGNKYTKTQIQLYDSKKNKIVLDRVYIGDSTNPGFELSCDTGSLICTFSNIVRLSINDILSLIL